MYNASAKDASELKLPMPDGGFMNFVPICVNNSDDPASTKRFELGNSSGGIKERPISLELGGSFPLEQNGSKMWCYYMGKYEVTRRQYYSIVNMDKEKTLKKKNYPVTGISWYDALNFGNLYNQWLFQNYKDLIPKYDKSYGFLRLPTEEEWEFAARGASMVDNKVFRQKTPYPVGKLYEYEWFGGPTSSHNKLQSVGKLKPNPAGLYDMLGNADEMTMSLFKMDYYQGRTGGYVIKGNNYFTPKNSVRSSYRAEQPFYQLDKKGGLKPHTKITLGFRLVISAVVFTSLSSGRKLAAVDKQNRSIVKPKKDSKPIKQNKEKLNSSDLLKYIDTLSGRLEQKEFQAGRVSTFDILEKHDWKNIDSIYIWIRATLEQAAYIRSLTGWIEDEKLLISVSDVSSNKLKKNSYKTKLDKLSEMRNSSMKMYLETIGRISAADPYLIRLGFDKYRYILNAGRKKRDLPIVDIVEKHVLELHKNSKINTKKWQNEIYKLY